MKARHKDTGEIIELAEEGIIAHDGRHFCWYQVELIPEPIDEVKSFLPANLDNAEFEYAQSLDGIPANQEEEKMIYDAFISGAKLQYQKDRREFAKIKAKTWCEGFDAHKEQMVKDSVEGYVNYYEDSGGILVAEAQVGCPYHNGDKVRIVILKEATE